MSIQLQPTALISSIALALGFTSASSAADTQATTSTLDTIVVTATRSAEKLEKVPARISIIENNVLEQSPITSLPNLLKKEAAINVAQLGGYGQQSSIFMRGTSSSHTLVLRDGMRLNSALNSSASFPFIDTTDLKQIEVLKGPASVLYGTDAIGGVVHMISKTPEQSGVFITGEIGENQTYKSLLGIDITENGYYAQIRGQRLETDGKSVLDSEQDSYAFDQKGWSAKFGVEQTDYAASLDYNNNQGSSDYNAGVITRQHFDTEMINLKARLNLNQKIELNTRFSQFDDQLEQDTANYLGQLDYSYSTTQEAELYAKIALKPQHTLLVGTTYTNLDGDVLSYGTQYNGDVSSLGYYAQHQYQSNQLNTQLGLRVEDNEKYGSHTVAQAAARYAFTPNFSVYSNIGSAFRSPNLNELYSGDSANPTLKAEESVSYEIGFDHALNASTAMSFSLYQNDIKNMIQKVSDRLDNINEAQLRGGELALHWKKDQFFINTAFAYVQAKDAKTNVELAKRPRQTLTLTTGFENKVYGVSTSLIARSQSKSWSDNDQNPGYATIDLNAYWYIHPQIKLFANVENIGDVRHKIEYNWNNYYIDEGRIASTGLTLKY
jgi:vitamin B12 transporter